MPCLEAEPESWHAGGSGSLGGTTSVSSNLCGVKSHPCDAALARRKNGRRRSIALQDFDGRSRAALVVIMEG